MNFDREIARLDGPTVYFPVRHHSPAAARLIVEAIARVRPRAVLIEGPSDFNDSWAELGRGHRPPIAVYSYVARDNGRRSGAFYPFCVYSPEWCAIEEARARRIHAEFIDLPWVELSRESKRSHAYADGEERRASYIRTLVEKLGLESFDDLWDQWFEIDSALSLEDYLARCHELMFHVRFSQPVAVGDQRREAFMASRIRAALESHGAPVLVVTGAYHSWALFAGAPEPPPLPTDETKIVERGVALTPYSYERLDALRGYEAGMPNPGFYHRVWTDRQTGSRDSFQALLAEVILGVRARKQHISAADLITVESLARGLATLRGKSRPWRRELIDGIQGALIKDDLIRGFHPLLAVVHQVLRGDERGRLARGTRLPPLVEDIRRIVVAHGLVLERQERQIRIDLTRGAELLQARVLHRLHGLGIAGYTLVRGGQIARRDDLTQVIETWSLAWSEEFEATCIERSVYGANLAEASRSRLEETARQVERSAGRAAAIFLEASLEGHFDIAADFENTLGSLIREDAEFQSVTGAVNTLLYLYRYDDVLGARNQDAAGGLLAGAYGRGLWLVEAMLDSAPAPNVDQGIRLLRETLERCGGALGLDREEFTAVFLRLAEKAAAPFLRGAACGVLWSLAVLPAEEIALPLAADPEELGDFLAGLFSLAREAAQRHPELVERIDRLLMGFGDDTFLEALPALRLAFSPFTPREKHHLVQRLLGGRGTGAALAVSVEQAARAMAWESRLFADLARHGILTAPFGHGSETVTEP